MAYKTELHIHTRFSPDTLLSLRLLRVMCRIHGVQCVAITDHNEIAGALAFQAMYPQMSVIVGEEIFTSEGEIIGLFLKERIPPLLSVDETIKRIQEQGGLVYVPHPCDGKRRKTVLNSDALEKHRYEIQYIESYNGRTANRNDLNTQKEIADFLGVAPVVGSDAHTWFELGRNYHVTDEPVRDCESFKRLLPTSQMVTAPCIPWAHRVTIFAKIVHLLTNRQYRILWHKIREKLHGKIVDYLSASKY